MDTEVGGDARRARVMAMVDDDDLVWRPVQGQHGPQAAFETVRARRVEDGCGDRARRGGTASWASEPGLDAQASLAKRHEVSGGCVDCRALDRRTDDALRVDGDMGDDGTGVVDDQQKPARTLRHVKSLERYADLDMVDEPGC
ncbi:MAG: hypothetical protein JHC84_05585 [Solirubrobacteraceae bacterium]|nr:hypothetical protein [Solirubrobacteraceae bacterium]